MRHTQFHILKTFPASNPNRDRSGRPKTVIIGGTPRLRHSSQSMKRPWRTEGPFPENLAEHISVRTRVLGAKVVEHLAKLGADAEKAAKIATALVGVFGKIDPKDKLASRQLALITPAEMKAALDWSEGALAGNGIGDAARERRGLLNFADGAVDVAMFGRMMADAPEYNREAAMDVAHAFTTHAAAPQDDFLSAVDDLQTRDNAGAGLISPQEFGTGTFYIYARLRMDQLVANLAGNRKLAEEAVRWLVEAMATIAPGGKRSGFAHHTLASHMLVEKGDEAPRGLHEAFLVPVEGPDLAAKSWTRMLEWRDKVDHSYGRRWELDRVMDVRAGTGGLRDIAEFAASG